MCGNIGMLLLDEANAAVVLTLLQKMFDVTMARGAHSGGLVTYRKSEGGDQRGSRTRVVNGKRTQLGELLLARFLRNIERQRKFGSASAISAPQLFQGHTRFATSSLTTLRGCHPHQWTPPSRQTVWEYDSSTGSFTATTRTVEGFITHNGDLDFFEMQPGRAMPTEDLQVVLPHLLGAKLPDVVDSVCLAGLLDLHRTRGLWRAAVRYGYVFGGLRDSREDVSSLFKAGELMSSHALHKIGDAFAQEWSALVAEDAAEMQGASPMNAQGTSGATSVAHEASTVDPPHFSSHVRDPEAGLHLPCDSMAANCEQRREAIISKMRERARALLAAHAAEMGLSLPAGCHPDAMADEAVSAFFEGGLHRAALLILGRAAGSFGLTFSHSLDAGGPVSTPTSSAPATGGEIAVCAKGQPMSIAFYPALGMVLFGSEAAATKAGIPLDPENNPWWNPELKAARAAARNLRGAPGAVLAQRGNLIGVGNASTGTPFRYDLDDHGGEVVLLRWREDQQKTGSMKKQMGTTTAQTPLLSAAQSGLRTQCPRTEETVFDDGEELAFAYTSEGRRGRITFNSTPLAKDAVGSTLSSPTAGHARQPLKAAFSLRQRSVELSNNPVVMPLPPTVDDPVGLDIRQIPSTLASLRESFGELGSGARMTRGKGQVALTNQRVARELSSALALRLKERAADAATTSLDGPNGEIVDFIVAACEVSLWIVEQFVSDLRTALPGLRARAVSSNKLLALFGQSVPIPQLGHPIDEGLSLDGAVVLLVSHSGGTFATLACAKMLRKHTPHVFAVASEIDTHLGRVVNEQPAEQVIDAADTARRVPAAVPRCFSTLTGFRVAEPCSISVAATHQLLTHVLLGLMSSLGGVRPDLFPRAKLVAKELSSLCGSGHMEAIKEIVGDDQMSDTPTGASLRREGQRWAQHVLEGPYSWIMSAIYILATVLAGYTPLSAALRAARPSMLEVPATAGAEASESDAYVALRYVVAIIDSIIYAFLPWWTTVLLRLVQRRPWLHRVSGRSVLIADIPWVGQCAEAFLSKLFALSYSIAGLSVYSANPHDHLVHRHTHRVVRGALLAVGRPDGRIHSLAAAEATSLLSIKQASSIQSLGVTCETLTIGHNPWPLPRAIHLVLPTIRPHFLSEKLLGLCLAEGAAKSGNDANAASDAALAAASKSPNALCGLYAHMSSLARLPPAVLRILHAASTKGSGLASELSGAQVVGAPLSPIDRGRDLQFDALPPAQLLAEQRTLEVLYETRCASLQRLVSFFVLFHMMGKKVEEFWSRISFGVLAYDMSRTQSMMRVATTASPVSGMDV